MKKKTYRFYIDNPKCYIVIKASCELIAKLRFLLYYKQRKVI